MEIPKDIVGEITKYLDPWDKFICKTINKNFYDVLRQERPKDGLPNYLFGIKMNDSVTTYLMQLGPNFPRFLYNMAIELCDPPLFKRFAAAGIKPTAEVLDTAFKKKDFEMFKLAHQSGANWNQKIYGINGYLSKKISRQYSTLKFHIKDTPEMKISRYMQENGWYHNSIPTESAPDPCIRGDAVVQVSYRNKPAHRANANLAGISGRITGGTSLCHKSYCIAANR
jgi:hypothetical protein